MTTTTKTEPRQRSRRRYYVAGAVAILAVILTAGAALAIWQFFADTTIDVDTYNLDVTYLDAAQTATPVGAGVTCTASVVGGALVIDIGNASPDAGCDVDDLSVKNNLAVSTDIIGFEFQDGSGNVSTDIAHNPALDGSSGAPLEYDFVIYESPGLPTVAALPWTIDGVTATQAGADISIRVTDNANPGDSFSIGQGGLEAVPTP